METLRAITLLLRFGPASALGPVLVGIPLVAAVIAVASQFAGNARRARRLLVFFVAPSSVVALGWLVWAVTDARRDLARLLLPTAPGSSQTSFDPSEAARLVADAITRDRESLRVTTLGLACVGVLAGLVLARAPQSTSRRSALLTLVALAVATLITLVLYASGIGHCGGDVGSATVMPIDKYLCEVEELSAMAAILSRGRIIVGILAAFGLAASLRTALRERDALPAPGARSTAAASGVLALGIAAFASTRDMAWDARHMLTLDPIGLDCPVKRLDLPDAPAGCDFIDAPVLAKGPHGTEVDGVFVRDAGELTHLLATKRTLLQALSPGGTPVLLVAAAASSKPASLLPELRAAEGAGFSTVGILSRRLPNAVGTATVGGVARSQRCCTTRFRLEEHAPPLSGYDTWGDVLEAVVRASGPSVSPR